MTPKQKAEWDARIARIAAEIQGNRAARKATTVTVPMKKVEGGTR